MRERRVVNGELGRGRIGMGSIALASVIAVAGAAVFPAGCIGSEPQVTAGGDAGSEASGDVTAPSDVTGSDVTPSDAFTSDACTPCGTECVNVATDSRNCGSCGNACGPSSTCAAGKCVTACPTGQVSCGGTCIDPKTNPQHCGATGACGAGDAGSAGAQCGSGMVCNAGTCSSSCSTGLVNCDGACIDPTTSTQHCGATAGCGGDAGGSAGTPCAMGEVCSGGTCGLTCQNGLVNCGGTCIDPKTSNQHCGASGACGAGDAGSAGTTCALGQLCSNGGCVLTCSAAQPTACPAANPTYCTNTSTDPSNCGGCNQACAAGAACVNAQCTCPTQEPNACGTGSSQICTNFNADPQNCGGCGNVCSGGACFRGACICPSQGTFCGASGSNGTCCANGASCSGSQCQCPASDPCQTAADSSNHCNAGGPSLCSCDESNGWLGKTSCVACYHAFSIVGTNQDCDPSELPYSSTNVSSLAACYNACATGTDPTNGNAPCQFFAFYGTTGSGFCNLTSKCSSKGTPMASNVLYQVANGIPSGGYTTCP